MAVNPNQLGETYDQPYICGAFTLFKVVEAYAEKYGDTAQKNFVNSLCMFAGIATVADVMQLLGENRQLVRDAVSTLKNLYEHKHTPQILPSIFLGMELVLGYFKREGKLGAVELLNEDFLGFYLIPMLNSVKRMNGNIGAVYDIFFPIAGIQNEIRVENALQYLAGLNVRRKELVNFYSNELIATRHVSTHARGIYITSAPQGLRGLLAARFTSECKMPVIVLGRESDGSYKGSGRSPEWFDFPLEIKKAGLNNLGFIAKGHAGAFGVTCTSSEALKAYEKFFDDVVVKAALNQGKATINSVTINCDIYENANPNTCFNFVYDAKMIREYLSEYEKFRPWGQGFRPPSITLYFYNNRGDYSNFGDTKQHMSFSPCGGPEIKIFNKASEYGERLENAQIAAQGKFTQNVWAGVKSVNFIADNLQICEPKAASIC